MEQSFLLAYMYLFSIAHSMVSQKYSKTVFSEFLIASQDNLTGILGLRVGYLLPVLVKTNLCKLYHKNRFKFMLQYDYDDRAIMVVFILNKTVWTSNVLRSVNMLLLKPNPKFY